MNSLKKTINTLLQSKVILFILGGGLSALIDIGVMQSLIWLGVNILLSTSIGFGAGLVFNYFFHRMVTFSFTGRHGVLWKYVVVVGINYLITLLCVSLAMNCFNVALYGKIASLFIVGVNGYLLSKFWVFK